MAASITTSSLEEEAMIAYMEKKNKQERKRKEEEKRKREQESKDKSKGSHGGLTHCVTKTEQEESQKNNAVSSPTSPTSPSAPDISLYPSTELKRIGNPPPYLEDEVTASGFDELQRCKVAPTRVGMMESLQSIRTRALRASKFSELNKLVTKFISKENDAISLGLSETCKVARQEISERYKILDPIESANDAVVIDPSFHVSKKIFHETRSKTNDIETGNKAENHNETQISAPFITMGDTVLVKPPNLEDMNTLVKGAPDCTSFPSSFVSYIQSSTRYLQLGGADYRYILQRCLPGVSEQEIMDAVKTLRADYDKPTPQGQYNWSDPGYVSTMFKELGEWLNKRHQAKRDLTHVAATKQGQSENTLGFEFRFYKAWTELAGLPVSDDMKQLYISTFLTNARPNVSNTLKMLVDGLWDLNIVEFRKIVREKCAAGLLVPGKVMLMHSAEDETPNGMYYQNTQNPRNTQNQGNKRRGRRGNCHYCNKPGHWINECKQRMRDQGSDNRGNQPQPQSQSVSQTTQGGNSLKI
uniref:CCHC-type domain-containing protein n=1 Tax=Myripristis murdjan TaxID=586833 RepID=A0A667XH64_9TELE